MWHEASLGKKWPLGVLFYFSVLSCFAQEIPLDKGLEPDNQEVSNVFRDMGVVQRKAMDKSGKFLISTYGGFDFSDGPYTNYSWNINPGYAFSDFFEIYINIAPAFSVSRRSIVSVVEGLQVVDPVTGKQTHATLVAGDPKLQYGLELLWAPAYGKDSLGITHVIRSDTFFKLGISNINYGYDSGMKLLIGFGKTFFLNHWLGFRCTVDWDYVQTIINGVKSFDSVSMVEAGFVFYFGKDHK